MKNIQSKFKKSVLALAMSVALGSAVAQANKDSIDMGSASLSYASNGSSLSLSVAGSEMDVVTVYGNSSINWNIPTDIADGTYRYELSIVTPSASGKEEEANTQRVNGTFDVSNGVIEVTPIPESSGMLEQADPALPDVSDNNKPSFEKIAVAMLDFLMPTAEAANLTADSSAPYVLYKRNGSSRWLTQVLGNAPGINANGLVDYSYFGSHKYHSLIRYDANFHTLNDANIWAVSTASGWYSGAGPTYLQLHKNAKNSFIADSTGDIHLADNSVFIEKQNNRVGIGTIIPTRSLEIKGANPAIVLLDDNGIGDRRWILNEDPNSDLFNIAFKQDNDPVIESFKISMDAQTDTLQLLSTGVNIAGDSNSNEMKLGIGTITPENAIHIKRNSANIKIEDNSAVTAKRFQIQMRNNGGTGFKMTDTSVAGREWQFATLSNGSFTASYLGSGGSEFQILNDGRVTMGPGATTNFNLVPGGNLYINHGSVTATNFITSSSHAVKKDFEKVNADDLMNKLQNLEVTKWRYKDPEVKGHHIGPMAEDFYKLFELGPDNKHVVATDMAGIALIAAKELQNKSVILEYENLKLVKKTELLTAKTDRLSAENSNLIKRLASLEKLVTNLASSSNYKLGSTGDEVALK